MKVRKHLILDDTDEFDTKLARNIFSEFDRLDKPQHSILGPHTHILTLVT